MKVVPCQFDVGEFGIVNLDARFVGVGVESGDNDEPFAGRLAADQFHDGLARGAGHMAWL